MADRLPALYVSDREINGPIDREKTVHVFEELTDFHKNIAAAPATEEVLLFIAKKAGVINAVAGGLTVTGTATTDVELNIEKSGTPILTGPITIAHTDTDNVDVPGVITGTTMAYATGDKITATCDITGGMVAAAGPWIRINRYEIGD